MVRRTLNTRAKLNMAINFAAALTPVAAAIHVWRQNKNQSIQDWYDEHPDEDMEFDLEVETRHRILNAIVAQLRLAKDDPEFLDDVDTSSVMAFKDSFTRGRGWGYSSEEEFMDLFSCGETYEFDFTIEQCILLYEEFGIYFEPLPPPPPS